MARLTARAVVVLIATITSTFSSLSKARAAASAAAALPHDVMQKQSDIPAFFEPRRS